MAAEIQKSMSSRLPVVWQVWLLALLLIVAGAGCSSGVAAPSSVPANATATQASPGQPGSSPQSHGLPTFTSQPPDLPIVGPAAATPSPNAELPFEDPLLLDVHQADVDLLKSLPFEFLVVSNAQLQRWNSLTGALEEIFIAAPVISGTAPVAPGASQSSVLAVSQDRLHRNLAVLRSKGVAANGIELDDIFLYNYQTQQSRVLLPEIAAGRYTLLSPDGRSLVFIYGSEPVEIALQPLHGSEPAVAVGQCRQENVGQCSQAAWSTDSRYLAWSGSDGVWVYDSVLQASHQVVSDTLEIIAPNGSQSFIEVEYESLAWSPTQRYLSAWVSGRAASFRWPVIIDTRLKKVLNVPPGEGSGLDRTEIIWMQSGDLFVARPGQEDLEQPPYADIFRIRAANEGYFTLLGRHNLAGAQHSLGAKAIPDVKSIPRLLEQIGGNRFSYILASQIPGVPSWLSILDLRSSSIQPIAPLPQNIERMIWAPDLRRAVIFSPPGWVLYLDLDAGVLYDLTAVLGESLTNFFWLQ